jgi:bla regulator protein BlaR1
MAFTKISNLETIRYLANQEGAALLIAAVDAGKIKIVKAIIEDGVDINVPLLGDGTALMIAIKNKDITMIDALLSLNADPNIISPGDGTPIIITARNGNI